MGSDRNAELFAQACEVIPGGVNSPVRAFRAVGGDPLFVARGAGAYLYDANGERYLDYVQSWGASILGHAPAKVVAAVCEAAAAGTTFGAPTEAEVRLARAIVAAVPGCDLVRLVSSGTEAVMTAVRVARGATGRDRVVIFDGCYHGHSDAVLAAGGSGIATLGLPGSVGVPAGAVADTMVVPYNRVPELDERVALVMVEPVAANMGLVPPEPGFLAALRQACDEVGALLCFDEVITGFRLRRGSAAELFGVQPDLWCFGKVIGGGLPLAAVGGRQEVMQLLAPLGSVYQAGTLSGNPIATAAGLAVLEELTPERYAVLAQRVATLASGIADALSQAGVPATVPSFATLWSLFMDPQPVRDRSGARKAAESGAYAPFFWAMLSQKIALAPSPYEVAFTSFAHDEAEIDRTIAAARQAAREVARAAR